MVKFGVLLMLQELLVDLGDQKMGVVWIQNFELVLLMVLLHPSLVENLKTKICLQLNQIHLISHNHEKKSRQSRKDKRVKYLFHLHQHCFAFLVDVWLNIFFLKTTSTRGAGV